MRKGIVVYKLEFIVRIKAKVKFLYNELVKFANGQLGIVIRSENDQAEVLAFEDSQTEKIIVIGDEVTLLGREMTIDVSQKTLGSLIAGDGTVIKRFGSAKDDSKVDVAKKRNIFEQSRGIYSRDFVNNYLESGSTIIDWAIPIGKGQRELIIGDRKTGKSSIALNMLLAQRRTTTKCIYVLIGQKRNALTKIITSVKNYKMEDRVTIVNAGSDTSTTLRYLAPYVAMTIAEHFQKNYGDDVLVIFDDLSKHAIAYREISLLLENPPTRDAYPGDVFYIHSSLLERAGAFKKDYGAGSITAIPIVQTENGDISSFIPTNIISITDGQIFTSKDMFNANQRPAINVPYSVSRIGSSTQNTIMKEYASKIKYFISRYIESLKMKNNYGFVTSNNEEIIVQGNTLFQIIKQNELEISEYDLNIILLILFRKNYLIFLDKMDFSVINKIKQSIRAHLVDSLVGQKFSKMLKQSAVDIDKKLLNVFLELEILPIVKFHLLIANMKLENDKQFKQSFGRVRNDAKLLIAYREREQEQATKKIARAKTSISSAKGKEE